MSVELENDKLVDRMLTEENFYISNDDLQFISCDGKQCDPTICLRTSCKVFQYWRNKKE